MLEAAGPRTVAAFIAEPIVGATLAAAVPPDGYWEAIGAVLRRHGVLLITDEVMTGFGRTGRWFGGDHWGVRPDLLVAAKGASSGYWPFGFVAAAGHVAAALEAPGSFVHGFTYSHHPVGAAVAGEVLRILVDEDLVAASAAKGDRLRTLLVERLGGHPNVGEIRGRGLLQGVELVADRETRAPFPRGDSGDGVGGRRGPGCGRAALLRHGQRQRHRRRPDPARTAVRGHGRGAGAHRGRAGDRHRRGPAGLIRESITDLASQVDRHSRQVRSPTVWYVGYRLTELLQVHRRLGHPCPYLGRQARDERRSLTARSIENATGWHPGRRTRPACSCTNGAPMALFANTS